MTEEGKPQPQRWGTRVVTEASIFSTSLPLLSLLTHLKTCSSTALHCKSFLMQLQPPNEKRCKDVNMHTHVGISDLLNQSVEALFPTEINMQESFWFLLTSKWQKLAPSFIFTTPCPAMHYGAHQSFAANSGPAARWLILRARLALLKPTSSLPSIPRIYCSRVTRFLTPFKVFVVLSFQVRFRS